MPYSLFFGGMYHQSARNYLKILIVDPKIGSLCLNFNVTHLLGNMLDLPIKTLHFEQTFSLSLRLDHGKLR